MKNNNKKYKTLADWYSDHPGWVIFAITGAVFTTILAANSVYEIASETYREKISWKNEEQRKIDKLSPLETVAYVNEVLGSPIIKEETNTPNKYQKLTYQERGYWVSVYADKSDTVQALAITACGDEDFRPKIINTPFGKSIKLSETRMVGGIDSVEKDDDFGIGRDYFIAGATRPSYLYDTDYLAAPGRYQTAATGNNTFCGQLNIQQHLIEKIYENKFTEDDVKAIRSEAVINTIFITSPYINFKKDFGDFDFASVSVHKSNAGILTPIKQESARRR